MRSCVFGGMGTERKRVFVVDDSDASLVMAASALGSDYDVLTMPSAEKMFSLLEQIRPDLILLDIDMPDMDGIAAMAKLRENPEWADMPVIFITGVTDDEVLSRAMGAGAIEVIMKPFAPSILYSRVKYCL